MGTPQSNRNQSRSNSMSDMSIVSSPGSNAGLSFLRGGFLDRSSGSSPINPAVVVPAPTQDPSRDDPERPVSELSRDRMLMLARQENLARPDHVSFDIPQAVFDNLNFPNQPVGQDFIPVGIPFPVNQRGLSTDTSANIQIETITTEAESENTGPNTEPSQPRLTDTVIPPSGATMNEPPRNNSPRPVSAPGTHGLGFVAPAILAENNENQDEDYPPPTDIVSDTYLVASLEGSDLMGELRCIPYAQVKKLGLMLLTIKDTQLEIGPYFQVVLAYAVKFYSTLPDIGYSVTTLQLLHYYYRINFVRGPGAPSSVVTPYYHELCGYAMDPVIVLVARAFIDRAAGNSADLLAIESIPTLFAHVDYIRSNAPFLFVIYNILGHFIHGGIACISPIPKILMDDPGLSRYVERISGGGDDISNLTVAIQPRDPSLPRAPYQVKATPRAQDVPETSTRNQPRGGGSTSMFSAPGSSSAPPVRAPFVDLTSSDLLSQGDVGRVQVLRDTSAFRQAVDANSDIQAKLDQIISRLDNYNTLINQLQQDVRGLDQGLAILMTRNSQENLTERYSINQSLLTPQTQAAAALVDTAPTGPQPIARSLNQIIARLEAFPSPGVTAAQLLRELRDILSPTPHSGIVANLTETTIQRINPRVRLISTLKQIPRS